MRRLFYALVLLIPSILPFALSGETQQTEVVFERYRSGTYLKPIPVYLVGEIPYVATMDVAGAFEVNVFENAQVRKKVFRLKTLKIKFSAYTHFIMVEDEVIQVPHPAIYQQNDIYVPLHAFAEILKDKKIIRNYHFIKGIPAPLPEPAPAEADRFNIQNVTVVERNNGVMIRIQTGKSFRDANVKAWLNRKEWLYVTIPGGQLDVMNFKEPPLPDNGVLSKMIVNQLDDVVQLSFRVVRDVESVDVLYSDYPAEIIVNLRKSYTIDSRHLLNKEREKWHIDKIVLDAGHGGKDGGTVSPGGLREKDITLDVVKRLGKLIEDRTEIEVVFTRETDVFIPLWERTKIANEAGGKVFISVHVNASKNRSASGFETFLLRPGKSQEAIEVAELENSAIRLEEDQSHYGDLSSQQLILATMAQSAFMRNSETLASLIQNEFDKQLQGVNRGVKQAGFIVLIGASMPNVLVELGFISNTRDEARLKRASYRQKAAEAIFQALMQYKERHEKLISNG
ncbi:MAG: N-acetylmuramoyl-L-alanine amidase [Candidatus Marinimicrobia bacterium]|nr:N-acetylmuramoyl-L-alanine amidase [Candidatus Neomarinimicrobiota bacterium]MCF7839662.1 N-acetylmuramoyl-L-alanine amidase [Candidatus Neomarinimicrobiota bacterium]